MRCSDSALMAALEVDIFNYLKTHCLGSCQAIKAILLAETFQTNLRTINEAVRLLRKDGFLVGSSKAKHPGYYIPVTETEIDGYLEPFKDELYDMLETYTAQKRAKKKYLESRTTDDLFAGQDLHQGGFVTAPVPLKMGVST